MYYSKFDMKGFVVIMAIMAMAVPTMAQAGEHGDHSDNAQRVDPVREKIERCVQERMKQRDCIDKVIDRIIGPERRENTYRDQCTREVFFPDKAPKEHKERPDRTK